MCLLLAPVCMFNSRALVPVVALAALGALAIAWRSDRLSALRRIDTWFALLLAGYVCAALLSSLVAGGDGESFVSVVKLIGIVAMTLTLIPLQAGLTASDRQWVFLGLFASVALSLVWILLDIATDGSISAVLFGYEKTQSGMSPEFGYYGFFWYKSLSALLGVAVFVLGIYMRTRAGVVVALAVTGICILDAGLIGSRTAGYGILLALAAGTLYHLVGRHRLKILLAVLAVSFLFPLWIAASGIAPADITSKLEPEQPGSYSIAYRMHIWDYVTDKIMQKPALGWGAGSSKHLGTDADGQLSDPTFGLLGEPIPVHPHNGVLQIWLEYGAVGAIVVFGLLARALMIADRYAATSGRRIWGFSAIFLLICFFGFNFSISSSWWLASIVALAAAAAAFIPDREETAVS